MIRQAALAIAAALSVCVLASAPSAEVADPRPADCAAPSGLTSIEPSLARGAARIKLHEPLTIVAIGSSSTQGIGASSPARSYPSRLEAELTRRLPAIPVRVVNRGKGGEDAPEELARLERDVIAERPELAIWQVGTNAVLRRDDLGADQELIQRGVALLRERGVDVVLMDLQYAPRVVARAGHVEMEDIIARVARKARAGLFHRFELMRYWETTLPAEGLKTVGPDGLHMNDRGYGCLAMDLAEALVRNWRVDDRSAQRGLPRRLAGFDEQGGKPVETAVRP